MPFKVTEIQETPNPNARKFVLDGVIAEVPTSFLSRDQGKDHPIASQLFDISGVTSVLLLGDFVTVNKEAGAKWPTIIKRVRKILEEK
ncbi:MAG TPA: NifU N-terminal domain-containing protein [Tepidisphaeraceae bacterium]|nr:NifU N-terminal domain-containing protein [Tepidisphaeraceae bacterium]